MDGLFSEPPPVTRTLSRMYRNAYRATPSARPRWETITTASKPGCDECFATQYETDGATGPRAVARMKRRIKHMPPLMLCRQHEDLWRIKDREDLEGTNGQ